MSPCSLALVFVVFCVLMYSFAGLIRRTPPPTFSDTSITDRHSDTTIFQLRAHWVWISWSIGSEKSFGHVPAVGVEPLTSCMQGEHSIDKARLSAHEASVDRTNSIYSRTSMTRTLMARLPQLFRTRS